MLAIGVARMRADATPRASASATVASIVGRGLRHGVRTPRWRRSGTASGPRRPFPRRRRRSSRWSWSDPIPETGSGPPAPPPARPVNRTACREGLREQGKSAAMTVAIFAYPPVTGRSGPEDDRLSVPGHLNRRRAPCPRAGCRGPPVATGGPSRRIPRRSLDEETRKGCRGTSRDLPARSARAEGREARGSRALPALPTGGRG